VGRPFPALANMRWPEVDSGPRRVLVVPVGSLEQHGPHLPLDTDTRIAVAIARRACAGHSGVALAPAIAIGASGEHADFPGTLSAETSLILALAPQAVCAGAAAPGCRLPIGQLMPVLRNGGVRAVSANGVLGDPRGASAAEGQRLLAGLTAGLSETLQSLLNEISAGESVPNGLSAGTFVTIESRLKALEFPVRPQDPHRDQ